MERLAKKFITASTIVPPAIVTNGENSLGIIYYGSTAPAMSESFEQLNQAGIDADGLRIRAFPFGREVEDFIANHDQLMIVEQNSTGQVRSLLINELEINPAKLTPILHYDGTPITARFITRAVLKHCGVDASSEHQGATLTKVVNN